MLVACIVLSVIIVVSIALLASSMSSSMVIERELIASVSVSMVEGAELTIQDIINPGLQDIDVKLWM